MFKDDPKSFVARLSLVQGDRERYVKASSGNVWGDENGWLTLDDCAPPQVFCFDFLDKKEERLYYSISGASATPYAGKYLDVSRNGYLGFYAGAESARWGLELLRETEQQELYFKLIDPTGRAVNEETGMTYSKFLVFPMERGVKTLLNSMAGDRIATLCTKDIHFI